MSGTQAFVGQLKLMERGWRVLACILLLGFLGLFFKDLILACLTGLLASLLVYAVLVVRKITRSLERLVVLQPDRFESSLTAGESFYRAVQVESRVDARLRFTSPLENVGFEPSELSVEGSELMLTFHSRLAEEHSSRELRVDVIDRFGLVAGKGRVPFHLDLKVYPRVLAAAVEAVRFLLGVGGLGVGEQPTKLKGAGLDYSGSREYNSGDTLRHMDWKATARLGRMVVKEFYVEGDTGMHLAFEAKAPDPVSADMLSTAFLNTVLAVARQDFPLGLTVHDGAEVSLHVRQVQPALAVGLALQYALKTVEADVEQLYAILEPKSANELRSILQQLDQTPFRQLFHAELRALRNRGTKPYHALQQLLAKRERLQLTLITSLLGDPLPVLEFAATTHDKGCPLLVLQPTKPWIGVEGLEEAYRLYERYARLSRSLEKHGIRFTSSVEKLYRHLSGAQILARVAG